MCSWPPPGAAGRPAAATRRRRRSRLRLRCRPPGLAGPAASRQPRARRRRRPCGRWRPARRCSMPPPPRCDVERLRCGSDHARPHTAAPGCTRAQANRTRGSARTSRAPSPSPTGRPHDQVEVKRAQDLGLSRAPLAACPHPTAQAPRAGTASTPPPCRPALRCASRGAAWLLAVPAFSCAEVRRVTCTKPRCARRPQVPGGAVPPDPARVHAAARAGRQRAHRLWGRAAAAAAAAALGQAGQVRFGAALLRCGA